MLLSLLGGRRLAVTATTMVAVAVAVTVPAAPASGATPDFCPPGQFAGQCSNPMGVAVDDSTGEPASGDVYVADEENRRIDVFDSQGDFLRAFGWGVATGAEKLQVCTSACRKGLNGVGAGEIRPIAVVVDDDPFSASFHDVYVVDSTNERIQKFAPSGEFVLMFGKEVDKTKVAAHALEAQQDLCTKANIEAHDICGAGTRGATLLGGRGSGPGVINTGGVEGATTSGGSLDGSALSVDAEGDVWLGDVERLEKFNSEGGYVSELKLPGFGGVTSLAAAPAGDFYALSPPIDETQEIVPPTSGTYTLEFEGQKTAELPFNASYNEVGAALNGLSTIGENAKAFKGNGNAPLASLIQFSNALAHTNVPPIVISSGSVSTVINGTPGGAAKLGPSGEALQPFDPSGHPNALAFDPATGGLFVSDQFQEIGQPSGIASLLQYDSSGTQTESLGTGAVIGAPTGNALALGASALYVASSQGQENSAVQAFPLPEPGPLPEEDSEKAEPIGKTTATLNANVNPEGHPTTVHFEYISEVQFKQDREQFGAGTEKSEESEPVGEDFTNHPAPFFQATGLTPETTYRFRLVATNEKGIVNGETATFTTLPPLRIDATYATTVSATAATLAVELSPLGDPATYRFEYLTQAQYEANGESFSGPNTPHSSPTASAGTSVTDVIRTTQVQGLEPSIVYRYRVLAANAIRPAGIPGPVRSLTTQSTNASSGTGGLPDHRQYELVSPPNKHGAPLEAIAKEGADIQAAADGSKLTYIALAPASRESAGTRSPEYSQLLSTRGAGGWATQEISTPHEEITPAKAGHKEEYRLFSEDLSAGIVEPEGATPLSAQTTERTPYRREADGEYVPLVTAANVLPGTHFGGPEVPGAHEYPEGVVFQTATPDLSHVVLQSPQALTPGFGTGFVSSGNVENLYELSEGRLALASVLPPNGKGEEQPAAEAGLTSSVGHNNRDERGAISSDGNRVVFETSGHLYVRDLGLGRTVQVDRVGAGAAGGQGAPVFKGASSDGGRVFFLDESRLTVDASASQGRPDLYMCEVVVVGGGVSCELSDLTVALGSLESAGVQQVSAIDSTGTHVYFAANGVLTGVANTRGEHAVAEDCEAPEGMCNLYVENVDTRQVGLVAVLSHADRPDWQALLGELTVRVSPDGRFLVFMSERSLTGYDNRDAVSGALDEEVFLFDDSTGVLRCVSCDPSGARPHGVFDTSVFPGLLVDRPGIWPERWLAGSVPGWTLNSLGEQEFQPQSRYVSDGGRVFFDSADALVPQDTNGVEDVYEWEPPAGSEGASASDSCTTSGAGYSPASGGCVSLISSGTGSEESAFLDASESGDDVFFLTGAQLSPLDVDTALDVYDAHVCSVWVPCLVPASAPPVCEGDACQNPVGAPNDTTPGSLTFNGPGNLAPAAPGPPKVKLLTRAEKLVKALGSCRHRYKKSKARRERCEKAAHREYSAGAKAKRATGKIGGRRDEG